MQRPYKSLGVMNSPGKPASLEATGSDGVQSAPLLRTLGGNVLAAAAYWQASLLVLWYFSRYEISPAPIWLPAGVALFAALVLGNWSWPGIFVGCLLGTITLRDDLGLGAVIGAGNALAAVVGASLARGRMRDERPFSRLAHVFFLGKAILASGAVAATVGATAVWIHLRDPLAALPVRWFEWVLSDSGAALLLVPLLMLLPHLGNHRFWLARVRGHALEFLLVAAIAAGTVIYLLHEKTALLAADAGASFLLLLPLLWMAVRFSLVIACPMFVAEIVAVIVGTLAGYGPYAGVDKGGACLIFAQMVIGFGLAVLLLGAASEEQRATEQELRELNRDLENRIDQRTAELRQSKEQMEKAALHDPLTGLPNRRYLEQRFSACRSAAARKRTQVAVLLIDLDHFKQINDTIGHDAGDVLLVETGRRLVAAVREYDVVARMGGDEFAVLLPDAEDEASVDTVCKRIVRKVTDRIFFNGSHIVTSPSIGVAVYPEHGDLWQEVYKASDLALYDAKRAGRCRWEWYRPEQTAAAARGVARSQR